METQTEVKEKLVARFLDPEEKSPQQREQELFKETQQPEPVVVEVKETEEVSEPEFKDEEVLGYLGKKLNKTFTSFDDLFVEKKIFPHRVEVRKLTDTEVFSPQSLAGAP